MADSMFDAAKQHHAAGRLDAAEQLYRRVLDDSPRHADAAFLLGSIALQSGRAIEARNLFRRAVAQRSDNGAYFANLGEALRRTGQVPEAVDAFVKAMFLRRDLSAPAFNLGLLLRDLGELDAAVACFERAAVIAPSTPLIEEQLASAREDAPTANDPRWRNASVSAAVFIELAALAGQDTGPERRVELLRRAVAIDRSVRTLDRLGEALAELGETDEAIECFRDARRLAPDDGEPVALMLDALSRACRLTEATVLLRHFLTLKNAPELRDLLLTTMPYLPAYDDAAILTEARAWDRNHGASPTTLSDAKFVNDRSPDRPLRIGYVSRDFRDHAHKLFLRPLFANRDRGAFRVFLYADVAEPDSETEHFERTADDWRDIARLDDASAAELVRRDEIDVLVDLTMHLAKNRLLLFARKPAPVQICWLAYPGTTGLAAMDYRISDPYLDPADVDLGLYSERSLRLPDCFWCYDPCANGPEPGELPARRSGHVTFGCLNNFVKVGDEVIALWARVLRGIERSRMVVLAPKGDVQKHAIREFGRHGIAPGRVELVDRLPRSEYLATYRRIDLCLDTFPCCGHTTSLDALWMGVPVVTLRGKTVIGRAGASLLMNLGLPELLADTYDDYARIAVDLCVDLPRLEALRSGLRPRMHASPLMDGARFAANMEALYLQAWREWCASAERSVRAPSAASS
jgi:protein O-GlcNAc transferase